MEWIGIAATAVVCLALFASMIIPIMVGEDTVRKAKEEEAIK